MISHRRTLRIICALIMSFIGLVSIVTYYAINHKQQYDGKQLTIVILIFGLFLLAYGGIVMFAEFLSFIMKRIKKFCNRLMITSVKYSNSINSNDEALLRDQV